MAGTREQQGGTVRLLDTIDDAEHGALEAVRKFLDTVDETFPALSDDRPRRKIIDSAFKMTEELVSASNRVAQNILDVTGKALSEAERKSAAPLK